MISINKRLTNKIELENNLLKEKCRECPYHPDNNPDKVYFCQEDNSGKMWKDCNRFRQYTPEWFNTTLNIPAKYHNKDISNFINFDKLGIDLEKVIAGELNLYFHGPNGSGKSHASYGIYKEIMYSKLLLEQQDQYNPFKCRIIDTVKFFQQLQSDMNGREETTRDIEKSSLLLWEEFSKAKPTDFVSDTTFRFVKSIDDNLKPQLIANSTLPLIASNKIDILHTLSSGADIYSRFKDIFKNGVINLSGTDRRG